MTMWYFIFLAVMFVTAMVFLYLGYKISVFPLISKVARNSHPIAGFIGVSLTTIFFIISSYIVNMVNAIIIITHLAVFWAIFSLLFRIIKGKNYSQVLCALVSLFVTTAYLSYGWYLDFHIFTTEYKITTQKNVPATKIALIADSHVGTTFDGAGFAEYMQEIQSHNPDFVFVSGDFVDDDTSKEDMLTAVQALGNLKTTYGVYLSLGNHDEGYHSVLRRGYSKHDLIEELQKNGVIVLNDEISAVSDKFYVIGRKDKSEKDRGRNRLSMEELTAQLPDKDKFIIVLDHQPNDYVNQTKSGVDLVLSGHTHGGQIFPLNKVGEWIKANDKTYGLEKRENTNFIVTSGISDWAIKFKTGCKSEIVLINIDAQ